MTRRGKRKTTSPRPTDEEGFLSENVPPLLEVDCVDAVCISVESIHCPQFGKKKSRRWLLMFRIVEPAELEGTILPCFVRVGWKKAPLRSKLAKMASVANHRKPVHRISRALFLKKVYRCRVARTKTEPAYNVIETMLECLAG